MSDPMQGILAEAKSNKYSQIKDKLSEEGKLSILLSFSIKWTYQTNTGYEIKTYVLRGIICSWYQAIYDGLDILMSSDILSY